MDNKIKTTIKDLKKNDKIEAPAKEKYKPSPGFGGRREGSGRKHTRQQVTTQIDLDLWDKIKDISKRNDFINMCIREHFEKEQETAG